MARQILRSQKGFSILNALIAVAIGLIAMTAMTHFLATQNQGLAFVEDRMSRDSLEESLRLTMMGNGCMNTLGGKNIMVDQNINTIRDGSNAVVYNVAPPAPKPEFDSLKILSFTLYNIDVPLAPNSNGKMKLVAKLERKRGGGGGKFIPASLTLNVQTNGASRISNCSPTGDNGLGLTPSSMPCVLNVVTKTGTETAGLGDNVIENYTSQPTIFFHGETGIPTKALQKMETNCMGTQWAVYDDTYSCNNKVLTRTSHTLTTAWAWGPYTDSCGP